MSILTTLSSGFEMAIELIAPAVATKREQARSHLDILRTSGKRYYDAASRGRRTEGWRKVDLSPEGGVPGLKDIQTRSRDLVRNNGWVKKGVGGIVSNTIGTGIVPQVRINSKDSKRKKAKIEARWKGWANSTKIDFDGLHNFAGLQRLAVRTMVESGEVLIRKRNIRPVEGNVTKVFPVQLQILECDYLDCTKDGLKENGNTVVQGVEFNPEGQRVAYHIYKRHPGGRRLLIDSGIESIREEAENCIHLFRIDRPGQVRGVPWTAAIVLSVNDLGDYEDAELMRRKVAACFAGFINADVEDRLTEGTSSSLGVDKMEPGMVERLNPGESITFANPPTASDYQPYTSSMLHKISAGLEVPYEVLTGDYSQTNYSSGRLGWLEFHRLIEEWRWLMIVPRFLTRVWEWFSDAFSIVDGTDFSDVEVDFTAPRRELIDPAKEIPGIVAGVRAGFQSLPEAIREMGYDPEQNLLETAEFNARIDALAIILDSDPRVENNQEKAKAEKAKALAANAKKTNGNSAKVA